MHVAQHTGLPNDWLNRTGPDNVRRYLEMSRSLSRRLREDCATLGIPFFDTGVDFHGGIASAELALIDPAGRPREIGLRQIPTPFTRSSAGLSG
jgi:hypothetical protein